MSSIGLDRRNLLKRLGLGGVAAALLGTAEATPANAGQSSGSRPATSILAAEAGAVTLATGPFQAFEMAPGERLGVAIVVAGSPGQGPLPVVRDVASAELSGWGALDRDPAVVRGAYRLLGGLAVPRPFELYGFSLAAGSGSGGSEDVELTWRALLRGPAGDAEVRQYLAGFHALVIGQLGEGSLFSERLSYVEIRQVS